MGKDIFWQTYLNFGDEIIDLSKCRYITDIKRYIDANNNIQEEMQESQMMVYSPLIADLIIRISVEIETISKELYFINGGIKKRGDKSLKFDFDCIKLLEDIYEIDKKVVNVTCSYFDLHDSMNTILFPLQNADKSSSTYWGNAYQSLKHDRYNSLYKGNIKALLEAASALFLLNVYLRNEIINISYDRINTLDMRFGSKIFALNKPSLSDMLWYGNKIIGSDSPYAISYTKESYEYIKNGQDNNRLVLIDQIFKEPEMRDNEFLSIINNLGNDGKSINLYLEIYKYRFNKTLPKTLSFNERKQRLITMPEWNNKIRLHNRHILEKELTSENIDKEIDNIAWQMSIIKEMEANKIKWEIYSCNALCEAKIYKLDEIDRTVN